MPLSTQAHPETRDQDGWQQGVEFGGGLGLQSGQWLHLCLQVVKVGHQPLLLGKTWQVEPELP
jgi:hypothetical protein